MNENILHLTSEILNCRKCRLDKNTFLNGETVLGSWAPPRGWAGMPNEKVDIVIVALNPGAPFSDEYKLYDELGIYESNTNSTMTQAIGINNYSIEQYRSPSSGVNWIFHRKSVALANSLLWLIDRVDPGDSLWQRVWFTDVFKCSTKAESNPNISLSAERACRTHIVSELDMLKPKLVIALGGRVSDALNRSQQIEFVKFRHPSNGCKRIDDISHDQSFVHAAELLGVVIPDNFRSIRQKFHEVAFAR